MILGLIKSCYMIMIIVRSWNQCGKAVRSLNWKAKQYLTLTGFCINLFQVSDDEEEDMTNPSFVPKRTGFWDHDDRYENIKVEESRCVFSVLCNSYILV